MQSQTHPRHPSSPATNRAVASGRAIPSVLYWLVALAVGSSFYVVVEPAPTDILFLLLFVVVLFKRGIRFPRDLNPLVGLGLLLFVAGSALSLLWAQEMEEAALYLSVTFYLVVSWYILVTLLATYGPPMADLILRAFLVAATIVALIGLIGHFSTVLQDYLALQSPYGERARGTFKDPNVYAPFLCAALLVVLNRMVTRGVLSLVAIVLLCLFATEILAAFSRGAYGNILVALAVFLGLQLFVLRRRDWLSRCLILFGLALVVVLPLLVLFLEASGLDAFLESRLRLQAYDLNRFETQAQALAAMAANPFGIGPGQTTILLPQGTHNLYLRVAIENGIPAALGFCAFLAGTLWVCLRGVLRRHGPFADLYACCLAILAGILVNSFVIDSLHWRYMFLFLALPVGLARYERQRAREAAPLPLYAVATRS